MTAKVITDPSELANLIEGADRLMLRLGGENSFHKLPDPEAAMVVSALRAMASPSEASGEDYKALYSDLLYAVGNKYPGETRHQTARRYILQAEWVNSGEAQQASQSDKEESK